MPGALGTLSAGTQGDTQRLGLKELGLGGVEKASGETKGGGKGKDPRKAKSGGGRIENLAFTGLHWLKEQGCRYGKACKFFHDVEALLVCNCVTFTTWLSPELG